VAVELVKKDRDARVRVTPRNLGKYLGPSRYRVSMAEEEYRVGVANGLAWTDMGGEILTIEVTVMPGQGKLLVTGRLGDVMQESAQAAMSYVRSRAADLALERDFYQKIDVHIHIPEGAIPKDGPSAGITIVTALVSALTKIPVHQGMAMTGEVTLRGRILPIGGLKEKLLAAHRGGVRRVMIPAENEKDLHDVPARVKKALRIDAVEHMDEVLRAALMVADPENFLKREEAEAAAEKGDTEAAPPEEGYRDGGMSSPEVVTH
jgi:ATP-dependent Lon protease